MVIANGVEEDLDKYREEREGSVKKEEEAEKFEPLRKIQKDAKTKFLS